jgi:hypothetical protein
MHGRQTENGEHEKKNSSAFPDPGRKNKNALKMKNLFRDKGIFHNRIY